MPLGICFPENFATLPDVHYRQELMLTRRRAVDLCRLGGCCCSC
ncbi:putative leader peptide [Rhodococcus sp. NPDC003382]